MKALLKLPRISMNMEEGTITVWRMNVGDRFQKGDVLYEIETEKSNMEVEAPCDGSLIEILAPSGETVAVGDGVCRIEQIS